MAARPQRGVAIKTAKDIARSQHLALLHEQWALIDAHMDDALGESTLPTRPTTGS